MDKIPPIKKYEVQASDMTRGRQSRPVRQCRPYWLRVAGRGRGWPHGLSPYILPRYSGVATHSPPSWRTCQPR